MAEFSSPLLFYSTQGLMTNPSEYSFLLENLPSDISNLCEIVQNNLLHIFWAEGHGVTLTDELRRTVNVRRLSDKLAHLYATDPHPLFFTRSPQSRQVGNCRDFSLLMTALLRQQDRPARSRCGFGRYFLPDHYEDHWVCEYWSSEESRWIMVDSQLDVLQIRTLAISFDPTDVPSDQFITGGKAWQMCRAGLADPAQFGIFDMHGWWFIWGNVIRDFLALNKLEILPWDGGWGFLEHQLTDPLPDESELMAYDEIAELSASPDLSYDRLRSLAMNDDRFHLPDDY